MTVHIKLLVVLLFTWQATGQAPGDFNQACRDGILGGNKNFQPDVQILLDTSDYIDLFEGTRPVWLVRDLDQDTITWDQNIGGICAWSMNALGFTSSQQPQNNWLFSQHISYMDANEIFFNISVDFTVCASNPMCDDRLTLYRYDTNGTVDVAQRTNPLNYRTQLIRLEQRPENSGGRFLTFSLVRPEPRTAGFYLGIQDEGTQGIISRIIVFYYVARGRNEDLLICPDVPFPVQGANVNSQESCNCTENAGIASATLVRSCNENGVCNEDQVCGCNPGFTLELVNGINTCIACPEGTFKVGISNSSCMDCPLNSDSRGEGNAVCDCIMPNIRNEENPQDPCTMPPSSPRLILSGSGTPRISQTSISVCWLPAENSGGLDDLHYNVYLYDSSLENPDFLKANDEGIFQETGNSDTNVCYEVQIISGMTNYGILVVSANGATGDPQRITDVDTIEGRFVAFFLSSQNLAFQSESTSCNVAVGVVVTLFVTLLFTAVITAVIVVLVMKFFVQRSSHGGDNNMDRVKYNMQQNSSYDTKPAVSTEKAQSPATKTAPPRPTRKPPPPRPYTKPVNT